MLLDAEIAFGDGGDVMLFGVEMAVGRWWLCYVP